MSEVLYESTSILSDIKIVKMMSDYGFIGFGYYMAVVAELYKIGGKCDFGDLGIIAKNTGIDRKKLHNFIDNCINKYTCNGIGIFQSDNNSFWSDKVTTMLATHNKAKKKCSGEKTVGRTVKNEIKDKLILNDIEFVNLDKTDYANLCNKFGEKVINTGIQLLDNWLALGSKTAKTHVGQNHYWFFRKDSWVINEAKLKIEKENNSQNTVKKTQELQAKVAEVFAKRKKKQ